MSAAIDIIQDGYSHDEVIVIEESQKYHHHEFLIGFTKTKPTADQNRQVQRANGSCCLVRSSGLKIIFDTMGPWEKNLLLDKLNNLKIHVDDIDYVIGSHAHPDHIGNMNLFQNCKRQFIGIASYYQDMYFKDCFTEEVKLKKDGDVEVGDSGVVASYKPDFQIDKNLSIIATPGHTSDDVSLLIQNCDKYGRVALAGDLFERGQDLEDDQIWLVAGSAQPDVQRHNRGIVLNSVDWIMPGHGPIFKTDLNR